MIYPIVSCHFSQFCNIGQLTAKNFRESFLLNFQKQPVFYDILSDVQTVHQWPSNECTSDECTIVMTINVTIIKS